MRHFKPQILTLCAVAVLAGCSPNGSNESSVNSDAAKVKTADAGEVNIYTSRHYDTDLALYDDFTDQTGIQVNRIEAKSNALIERIKSEGEFSPADMLITVDAGVLWRAEEAEIISPVKSDVLNARIPAYLRHPNGEWFGLSKRARVIIYNKANGRPENLNRYEDLADAAHKGKICMRSSSNIYNISLLSSIVERAGEDAAGAWAKGVVDNFARRPQSNDSGQIEAVASGECGISMVNTYYLARYAGSDDPAKRAIFDNLGVVFPNQDGRGTHVNISGAAVTRHAPNRANSVRFLEYLTSVSAQAYFADGNNEYPVASDAPKGATVKTLGTFKEDSLDVSTFGPNQETAIKLFDKSGWN